MLTLDSMVAICVLSLMKVRGRWLCGAGVRACACVAPDSMGKHFFNLHAYVLECMCGFMYLLLVGCAFGIGHTFIARTRHWKGFLGLIHDCMKSWVFADIVFTVCCASRQSCCTGSPLTRFT